MNLIAFTQDLSISNFVGLGIGTKVEVLTKEQFYKDLNSNLFRGIYSKIGNKLTIDDYKQWFNEQIDSSILDKLVLIKHVFNWTEHYGALYHIEYSDLPNNVSPPAFLRITRLENTLDIQQ